MHDSGDEDTQERQARLLRAAFGLGAITDAFALVPMLIPQAATLLWGFETFSGPYYFAMGYGASLMLGWTVLLVWAYQRPLERAFVAPMTLIVVYGLIATEVAAVQAGYLAAVRMIPTWCIQALLVTLFATAYHYPALRRRAVV